jgi:hypothetical protein
MIIERNVMYTREKWSLEIWATMSELESLNVKG